MKKGKLLEEKSAYNSYKYTEYEMIKLDSKKDKTEEEPFEENLDKKFDMPLTKQVYNKWVDKNPHFKKKREKNSNFLDSTDKIEEYELLEEDNYELSELQKNEELYYQTVKFEDAKEITIESIKKTDNKDKKIFDLPIINSVYNDWVEKKHREKNPQ